MELYELSHPQRRILLSHLKFESAACNIGGYVLIHGEIKHNRLKAALQQAAEAMDCFRIRLHRLDGSYWQYFSEVPIMIEKLQLSEYDTVDSIQSKAAEILEEPFVLEDSPLYRIIVINAKNNFSGYILKLHHIIMDGWSVKLFCDNVNRFYNGEEVKMGHYTDFLFNERQYLISEKSRKDKKYWDDFVNSFQLSNKSAKESTGFREEFLLSVEEERMLKKATTHGGSETSVLIGFLAFLSRITGKSGIIDIPSYNRIGKAMRKTGGMFTGNVLINADEICNGSMQSLVLNAQRKLMEGLRHQAWPYDLIHFENGVEVFHYSANCYNTTLLQPLDGIRCEYQEVYPGAQLVPFQAILKKWNQTYSISFDMLYVHYHAGDGAAFYHLFHSYLNAICSSEINVTTFCEQLLTQNLSMQKSTFSCGRIFEMTLSERLQRTLYTLDRKKEAIVTTDGSITYEDFSALVSGAVEIMQKDGLSSGSRVVIWLPNSIAYLVYVYAACALGIVWIPVDYSYPSDYVLKILEDSCAELVITDCGSIEWKSLFPELKKSKREFSLVQEDSVTAYILYTSGTTGTPKGVKINRKALAWYLNWAEMVYSAENFFIYSSPSFDLSLTTVFLPITSGGSVILPDSAHANLLRLGDFSLCEKVTAIKATPSNLSLLLSSDTSRLKLNTIICGGEELTVSLAEQLQTRFGSKCRIYNEYGPTECTIGCMCHCYNTTKDILNTVSIGKAAPGNRVYIVDTEQHLCLPGMAGEIYLSGNQLADGYHGFPEENRTHFIHDFYGENRAYRTGDLGRYHIDGTVEYLGRVGRQCKLNGYRIELDGIEKVLLQIKGVNGAAVWVNNRLLVAAVATDGKCTETMLAEHIRTTLPSYCVPHRFLMCSRLPITINGKIDYSQLGKLLVMDTYQRKGNSTDTTKSRIVEKIIRKAFNYNGNIENFDFLLEGGDSIRALGIVNELESYGYHASISLLMDYPAFNELLVHIEQIPDFDNTEVPHAYHLPAHLCFLKESCSDFTMYHHRMVLKIPYFMEYISAISLKRELFRIFPSLNATYRNNYITETKTDDATVDYLIDNDVETWMKTRQPNSVDTLFSLSVLAMKNESLLLFDVHHILVDGISWMQLISAAHRILSGLPSVTHTFMNSYLLQDIAIYEDCMDITGDTNPIFYRMQMIDTPIPQILSGQSLVNALTIAAPQFSILYDFDGRFFLPNSDTDNLGCFSVFIPVTSEQNSLDVSCEEVSKKHRIHFQPNRSVKLNFLGDISNMIRDTIFTGSEEYIVKCIQTNMFRCSAFGCVAEVTAWVDNQVLQLCISRRNNILSDKEATTLIEDMADALHLNTSDTELSDNIPDLDDLYF